MTDHLLIPGDAAAQMTFEQVNMYNEFMSHTYAGQYLKQHVAFERVKFEVLRAVRSISLFKRA